MTNHANRGPEILTAARQTSTTQYVELHARSAFSFLEGASVPEELAFRCAELQQPAMALSDAHGVYGAPRFHMAACKLGIRALIGAEVCNKDGSRYTLLAENRQGYQNLCRLITRTKLRDRCPGKPENPFATQGDFAEFAKGLVCLTGGVEGSLARIFSENRGPRAKEVAQQELERITATFGKENVFIELQRHYHRKEEVRNQALVELARSMHLPLLASNGVSHAIEAKRELQDVLTCVKHKTTISEAGRLLSYNAECHLKSSAEMNRLFADLPDAIAHTGELASRLSFTLEDLGYEFPHYPVPDSETEISFLRKRTEEGARRRYRPYSSKARQQIEKELALIEKLKLEGYFLIVWDIVEFCRRNGILVQGRGSAANSAVCYSLGITAVDPVGMDLLFERFLSEERGEWPDIDIDLPSGDRREQAIQYLYQRYGELGAAMTANVITYRSRSAVRDVGKVLGFPAEELKRLADLMPQLEWRDPNDTLERRFREAGLPLHDPRIAKFFSLTGEILDLPRHLGQHSGGMVICAGQLDSIVPLEPATMPGRVVVQWDKDDCADMKIVKVDLLGLGMMAVLQDCLEVIPQHYGTAVDLAHLPQNDPLVYDALQQADTLGLFQVESRAQQAILPRMKPKCFYDLVIQVAIIRPGPIVGDMLHPFLRRRQGLEKSESLHPWLDQVLERTLGVPLFQEQLLKMAMIVANFTGGEAEELRRAMGFKRSEKRMRDVEAKLRLGMTQNAIAPDVQERIVQAITSFALYGFPESHAASFALIAYASAFLKCHYLAAFTICMLNNQPMGFYSPATLVKDAQRHGQRFRPVDILRSDYKCTIEKQADTLYVRLGFNYVRGLRENVARAIVEARETGPFLSLRDLMRRVPELNKKEMAALANLGALNVLPKDEEDRHRRGALWQASAAARPVGPLLELATDENGRAPLSRMTPTQRISSDFSNSGLTIGKHPMTFHRERLQAMGVLDNETVKSGRNGAIVKIAGSVITRQRPGTARGFVFLSLEDETGIVNVIVNPDLFERHRLVCVTEPYLLIKGVLQNTWGVISVKAAELEPFSAGEQTVPSHDFH
jgi:error-prone DNA polymerase